MVLDEALFQRQSEDEIVLCLNYDGLYGINNVNRFLQSSNPSPAIAWGESIYKVGDPVLFNETDRFRPVIFNNLKGRIVGIDRAPGRITFDVELERTSPNASGRHRACAGSRARPSSSMSSSARTATRMTTTSTPRSRSRSRTPCRSTRRRVSSTTRSRSSSPTPTRSGISHSIFYTAITRARRRLGIFWTPETQQRILSRLAVRENTKDESLLKARRGVTPLGSRPKRQKQRPRLLVSTGDVTSRPRGPIS